MKHFADNNQKNNEPRHSARPSDGRRYAPKDRQRPAKNPDRFEKKQTELRIKRPDAPADGATKIYPLKKSEVAKVESRSKRPRTESVGTPTAPVPPTKAGYAPAFLFGGFILAMSLLFIFLPKDDFSASEKRYLAKFPEVTAEKVFNGEFGKAFEGYFADHFPSRNLWVGVNAYSTLAEGNNGANGVYFGKDGYLINKPVSTKNQIDHNLWILDDFKNYCLTGESAKIPMTAMFVPSTGYIADDKLPLVHESYHDDEFFENVAKSLEKSGIDFVDLRETFKSAHNSGNQLYYKNDHHWTTEGAYTAYVEYCKKIGIQPASKNSFNLERYEGFLGTTYSTSGFLLNAADTLEVWNNPKNTEEKISVTIYDGKNEDTINTHSMFFDSHDSENDKYPVFLDGNHALTTITNDNVKDGKIVVIKDSFSHCFAPFLAENFHTVILVDMRLYKGERVSDLISAEKPDQILCLYGMDNFAQDMDIPDLE